MNLFIEFLKNSFIMSIIIIVFIIFRQKLIDKYEYRLNYIIYILISLKLIILAKIPIYISSTSNNQMYNINVYDKNYMKILYYIWILGIMLNLLYKIYYNLKFNKYVNKLKIKVTDEKIINLLNGQKYQLKINHNIEIFKMNEIYTPMIVGICNPILIIPNKEYKDFELNFIFKHELIHYKRKDNFIKLILDIANTLHWFNPIIYILKKDFYNYCELSCDELVIKNCEVEEIKLYSMLLLDSIKYKNKLNNFLCSSNFNTSKSNKLKNRIKNMYESKNKKKGSTLSFICIILAIISLFNIEIIIDENNIIKAVGTNNLTGYIKKDDLYNKNFSQETLEQVLIYMKYQNESRTIPLYNRKGNIIGEYVIN